MVHGLMLTQLTKYWISGNLSRLEVKDVFTNFKIEHKKKLDA